MSALVFDIESNGLHDSTKVWVISAGEEKGKDIRSSTNVEEMLDYLHTADTLIGHNIINFDLPLLEKLHGFVPKEEVNIVDTLILSRLGNPDRKEPTGYTGKSGPHSLGCWGYRVCRAKPHHEDWSVYSPAMLERNREDVAINKLTSHLLSAELSDHPWAEAIELEHDVARIISKQEKHGVLFDEDAANRLIRKLQERVEDIDRSIVPNLPSHYSCRGVAVSRPFNRTGKYSKMVTDWYPDIDVDTNHLVGGPFSRVDAIRLDINSIKQIKDYLLDQGWIPTQYNYSKKTGLRTSPKLTEDSYGTIKGTLGQQIKERIICKHRMGQINGWIERLRPDGRLTASANTCGTNTGRFRHSNVANVPKAKDYVPYGKEMRGLFIVPPRYYLVGHDAEQLELRMLAHYMGDENYKAKILEGRIHEHNQKLAGLPTYDSAKTFIYALNYGAADPRLGSIIGGDEGDGRKIRRRFMDKLPNLEKLIKRVKRASNKGWLRGLDGRRLHMRRYEDGGLAKSKALNLLLQGAGAVVMKKSMVLLDKWVRTEQLRAYKVIDMHDEAQWEVYYKDVDRYMELAELSVVKAGEHFNLNIPLAAKAVKGKDWSETH